MKTWCVMKKICRIALLVLAVPAFGQFPGGPFPGGPYPGGSRYPRSPNPNSGPNGGRQQQPQDSGRRSSSKNAPVATTTTEGILRRVTAGQLVISADDHRVIWYRLTSRTTTQKDGRDADLQSFDPGDRVTVDSTEDDAGNFNAVAVQWLKAASTADRATASQTWDLPGIGSSSPAPAAPAARRSGGGDDDRPILRRKTEDAPAQTASAQPSAAPQARTAPPEAQDEEPIDNRPATTVRPPDAKRDVDDPGPPQLRRGTPSPRRAETAPRQDANDTVAPELVTRPAAAQPPARTLETNAPILPQEDPVIEKAREVAFSFTGSLPNFFCQQMTTRYQSQNPKAGWQAIDIVTADVAYEDGRESYKNIKIGGRAVNKAMEDIEGARSTGEFGTELLDLMSPQTAAVFKRSGQDTINGRSAYVFKFEVPRERSHWRIEAPSQLYFTAFNGSVWIDKDTSRVLRIEMEGRGLPLLFPFDTVETAVDYSFVRLAANDEHLLPVEAETLNCQRGTNLCSRNKIEFRNYRKFGAESTITFGEPQN